MYLQTPMSQCVGHANPHNLQDFVQGNTAIRPLAGKTESPYQGPYRVWGERGGIKIQTLPLLKYLP